MGFVLLPSAEISGGDMKDALVDTGVQVISYISHSSSAEKVL